MNAQTYEVLLSEIEGIITPKEAPYNKHVYHIYAIRVKNRDFLLKALAEKEIFCGIHYPVPVHLQKAYEFLGYKGGSFPIAEKCASEYISLPMFPELTKEQIEYVAASIKELMAKKV